MRAVICGSLAMALVALGCGDDDGGAATTRAERLIGPAGGTVELTGGGKVTIPVDALDRDVRIVVTELKADDIAELPSHMEIAGKPYAFEPHGLTFDRPVKLDIPYEDSGTDVRPMKLPNEDATTSQWTTVFPSDKDAAAKRLSFDVTSFSVLMATRPRRDSGVITLPDGAVTPVDAGMDSSAGTGGDGGDAGVGGDGGTGGDDEDSGGAGGGAGGTGGIGGTGGVGGTGGTGGMALPARWLRQYGSSDDSIQGVVEDSAGNVYAAGITEYALQVDVLNAGLLDVFIRKYDAAGVDLWTRQFGTTENDNATCVAIDSNDRVIVAGYTRGTLDQQTSAGATDSFLRVYDASGVEQWTVQFGGIGGDIVYGVAVDSDDNIYVGGFTDYFLPGQTAAGSNDVFLRKYDSAGVEQWTRQFGSGGREWGYGVAVDSDANVFIAGTTQNSLPGQTSVGSNDAFVRKYDSAGVEQWTRQFGGTGIDWGYGVAVDGTGAVVVAGHTASALEGQTSIGGGDAFLRKYDGDGVEVWTRQLGTVNTDYAYAAASDANGNVAIIGQTAGVFAGQIDEAVQDIYVRVYDASGMEQYTRQFGTRGTDHGLAVAFTASGRILVGGRAGSIFTGQMNQSTVPAALVTSFAW